VIAGGAHPDHTRICEFRRIHSASLQDLFVQVLQLCVKAGLVKLGHRGDRRDEDEGQRLQAQGDELRARQDPWVA
jgi:hypothetical protein